MNDTRLLPADWDPKAAADKVMAGLVNVCLPQVKGAHDADIALAGHKAYIVYEANDRKAGEGASWDFIYAALAIVDLNTMKLQRVLTIAESEQAFDNLTLEKGACFVPRIVQINADTLRCIFASEQPGERQSTTYYRDFDLATETFRNEIHVFEIETRHGVFPMQPKHFYKQAADEGHVWPEKGYGMYLVDGIKKLAGRRYTMINNYPGAQNALGLISETFDRVTVMGNLLKPTEGMFTEASVNVLPDGRWRAIARQNNRDKGVMFSESRDGKTWTEFEYRDDFPNGWSSKPSFDKFNNVYYLGWQDAARVDGVGRSIYNVDISKDGEHWTRKYRFETDKSFQYPVFREHNGKIYVAVTQGNSSDSRKERVMFGLLEEL